MEDNNKEKNQKQEKGKDFKTIQNSNSYKVTYEKEKNYTFSFGLLTYFLY